MANQLPPKVQLGGKLSLNPGFVCAFRDGLIKRIVKIQKEDMSTTHFLPTEKVANISMQKYSRSTINKMNQGTLDQKEFDEVVRRIQKNTEIVIARNEMAAKKVQETIRSVKQ